MGSELHKTMSPSDYGIYEVSTYPYSLEDGEVVDIVVLWCKRCHRSVWDSRMMDGLITP